MYYDYFDYNHRYGGKSKKFDALLEAWAYYKSRKASDYDYGDSFRITEAPTAIWCTEKPTHNEHGWSFGHEPTIEEKLRRAVTDAIQAWKKADEAYRVAYADFCLLAREEGYLAGETLAAEERAQRLHCIANNLWEKVEEAVSERDKYYDPKGSKKQKEAEDDLPF